MSQIGVHSNEAVNLVLNTSVTPRDAPKLCMVMSIPVAAAGPEGQEVCSTYVCKCGLYVWALFSETFENLMAKNVEIDGRYYEEILLGSSVYTCVIACRYLAYRHFFFFWIGNKVRTASQRKQVESAESSYSEEEQGNFSLPVKRACRDYSKPKYFEHLMAGEWRVRSWFR